jgi:WYL domain
VTLSFEHELAAAHRLAGFGAQVEVLSPPSVRDRLVATAQGILERYGGPAAPAGPGAGAGPGATGTSTSLGTGDGDGPGLSSPPPRAG